MIAQSHIQMKMQSRLFEYLVTDTAYTLDEFIANICEEVKYWSDACFCAIYTLDEWKGHFHLHVSEKARSVQLREHFSLDDLHTHQSEERELKNLLYIDNMERHVQIQPLQSGEKIFGFIVWEFEQTPSINDDEALRAICSEVTKSIKKVEGIQLIQEEKKKFESLYRVTSHFHSSIDIDGVLEGVLATVRESYPQFQYCLLLSQDYNMTDRGLPVRELTYDRDPTTNASTQAYLTGEVQMEDALQEGKTFLYAPLKGKQGVYGVLQVETTRILYFSKKDVEFFIFIASTAGKALENAQLYQQSRKLNDDLQLINSTSQKLNSNIRLTEKISYMAHKIQHSFQADEVGFITNEEKAGQKVLEGSTNYFTSTNSQSVVREMKEAVMNEKGPLFIGDTQTKPYGGDLPYRSLMAVPMKDHEHISGLAIVLHTSAYFFSFESFKLLQSLVSHSTLAFANSILREELEKAVITDYLTKLHSRVHLDRCVEEYVNLNEEGSLILFDIDNFKNINDTYGHQIGDEVICQVADLIQSTVGNSGLSARWGGEELAVYLPSVSSGFAHDIAEMVREKIASMTSPAVTVSCGLASWQSNWVRPTRKQIVQQADKALYKAKSSGKNRIVTAHPLRSTF